jgi:signal transduction histidine kinase
MDRRRGLLAALRAPLVWRFAPWVFTAILFVQALLCIPRIARERRSAYDDLQAQARSELEDAFAAADGNADALLASVEHAAPHVRGASIESAGGERIGQVGAPVESSPGDLDADERRFLRDGSFEVRWTISSLDRTYVVVASIDGRPAKERVQAFLFDLFALLGPAAAAGALATMLVAVPVVVRPLERLRVDLLRDNPDLAKDAEGTDDLDRVRNLMGELRDARRRSETAEAEARRASTARSEFFASMTHELRTPLHAILGYAEMLETELDLPPEHDARSDVARITENARRLLGIINDVLTFSKLESGEIPFRSEGFPLAALVDEIAGTIRPLATAKGNALGIDVAAGLDTLRTDRARLGQALVNLLGNAAKFTSNGRIDLSVRRDGSTVVFRVADTGSGIAPEDLPHVFEPYRQAGDHAARSIGTGLGLAIVARHCEAMGGRVEVTSELGEGTVFTMILQAERSP